MAALYKLHEKATLCGTACVRGLDYADYMHMMSKGFDGEMQGIHKKQTILSLISSVAGIRRF